jgi:hypothetical protein
MAPEHCSAGKGRAVVRAKAHQRSPKNENVPDSVLSLGRSLNSPSPESLLTNHNRGRCKTWEWPERASYCRDVNRSCNGRNPVLRGDEFLCRNFQIRKQPLRSSCSITTQPGLRSDCSAGILPAVARASCPRSREETPRTTAGGTPALRERHLRLTRSAARQSDSTPPRPARAGSRTTLRLRSRLRAPPRQPPRKFRERRRS